MNPRWWHLALGALAAAILWRIARRFVRHTTRRALIRFHPRVDRFKLTSKRHIVATLREDAEIAAAVRQHAAEHQEPESVSWSRVDRYLDEIVPFFSILAYYKVGYAVSRLLLNLFYKVSVEYERPDPFRGLPRDARIIYLMNHRSNADYVLVAYALAGDVSLSYAVGEWARAFPLEYIFKSFGSYFIRRRYREALYHTVLSRYVQLITRNGVTQGIFPEGGLTRDGVLRPAKVGLLDYALQVAAEPGAAERMYVIPVGINYDRVLEDRTLLLSLEGKKAGRVRAVSGTFGFLLHNLILMLRNEWRRFGYACVNFGSPVSMREYCRSRNIDFHRLAGEERRQAMAFLGRELMDAVGRVVPVVPVALIATVFSRNPEKGISELELKAEVGQLLRRLEAAGAHVYVPRGDLDYAITVGLRMLKLRHLVEETEGVYRVNPAESAVVAYYANSISHLL